MYPLILVALVVVLATIPPAYTLDVTVSVTLFSSPDSSFQVLVNAINSSRSYLFIEVYSVSNRQLIDLVSSVARRGVRVVAILEREHASRFEDSYTLGAAHEWWSSGVDVRWAPDIYRFLHAKFVVIDNSTVIVMSENWAKTGVPVDPSYGNRGWGIVIHNYPELARRFLRAFDYDYARSTPYSPEDGEGKLASYKASKGSYPHPFTAKTIKLSLKTSRLVPVFSPVDSEEKVLGILRSAETELLIQQLDFDLYWGSRISPLALEVINASARGVGVKVILNAYEKVPEDNRRLAEYVSGRGVEVRYSNNVYFVTTHNKGVVADGRVVLISSINWNYNSLHRNREAGIIVHNVEVASYYREIFYWDWGVGRPIRPSAAPRLVINEVELNPPGGDRGAEWIEIYNPGGETVNLEGWLVENSRGSSVNLNGSIAPGGFHVHVFSSLWLRNRDEVVKLIAPGGAVVDETPSLSDEYDDGRTWQRIKDGYDTDSRSDWVFRDGSMGRSNSPAQTTMQTAQRPEGFKIDRRMLVIIGIAVLLVAVVLVIYFVWVRRR